MNTFYIKSFDFCYKRLRVADAQNSQGLVCGEVGVLLCLHSLFKITKEDKYLDEMYETLNLLIEKFDNDFSLGYGISALTWMLELTEQKALLGDQIDELDEILEREFFLLIDKNNLDFYNGALGLLFYFSQKVAYERLDILISYFENRVNLNIEMGDLYSSFREKDGSVSTVINMGTPHGITGILLMFLVLKEKGYTNLDHAIRKLSNFLLGYCSASNLRPFFPSIIRRNGQYTFGRIAWCYGDLMGAYAILKTGILLNEDQYIQIGYKMLRSVSNSTDYLKSDLCLCHGHASFAHIYQNAFHLTGKEEFLQLAINWQDRTKKLFEIKFTEYLQKQSLDKIFENPSLFVGFSGVFMSLLTWETGECEWTKCLLI